MSIYAEDNAPGQSLPEFSTGNKRGLQRSLADLTARGHKVRIEIRSTKDGGTCGIALKLEGGVDNERVDEWLAEAAEAIHRHLDEKEAKIKKLLEDEING